VTSVFERVRSAEAILEGVVADLEPGTFDVAGAKKLVDLFTRCERLSLAGRGMAARRVEQAVSWKRSGHRSAAHWLASTTGVSVGAASRSLQTARELEALPETQDAFRAGELSEAQAAEIAATASLDPSAESRLLETVRGGSSLRGLRDTCREVSMRAAEDAAKARWLHETRAARYWTDGDGHWVLHASLAPDDAARVHSALETKTGELFAAARAAGRLELRSAYAADAVVALMTGEAPSKPIDVRLRADEAALDRGYAEPGEQCELEGIGPIPVTMARSLLQDSRITVLGGDGTDITTVSSPKRTIPAKLRRWLEATYPVCAVHGCDSTFRLEIDHIVPVAAGGTTDKTNNWRVCGYHHKLKTYYRWRVVQRPDGTRTLVPPHHEPDPPDDPDPP
jgi:hypothetical protein